MMEELLTLKLQLRNDLMTTVRLATGGVCSLAGLSLDGSEDCKVCVTESLLLLMHGGFSRATLRFCRGEGLEVEATGEGDGKRTEACVEDEISVALLTEGVNLQKEGGCLRAIGFRFGNGR